MCEKVQNTPVGAGCMNWEYVPNRTASHYSIFLMYVQKSFFLKLYFFNRKMCLTRMEIFSSSTINKQGKDK